MSFSLGYITAEKALIKKVFEDSGSIETEELPFSQETADCDVLVLAEGNEPLKESLKVPYSMDKNIGLCLQDFELIDSFLAAKIKEQIEHHWSLGNSLNSIRHLFELRDHLLASLKKGREEFFKNFIELLKLNLAATEIRIIFKDLKKDEKKEHLEVKSLYSREKSDLKLKVEDELDKILLQEYDEKIPAQYFVQTLKEGKRELVASFRMGGTPILMMLKLRAEFTSLHEALFSGLIKGLDLAAQNPSKKRILN
jgi:hypothetical protein